jgi:peptidoglycan biosynthesis protein MviN/MurJ (putative lipid II flippase)
MTSINFFSHNFAVVASSVACILGLLLMWDSNKPKNDAEETEQILVKMSFSYWLVYCISFGIQKAILPDWHNLLVTLKITAALSYFLTFSCILSLPLHKFSMRHIED